MYSKAELLDSLFSNAPAGTATERDTFAAKAAAHRFNDKQFFSGQF